MPEGSAHSILDGLYDLHETVGTGGFAKVNIWIVYKNEEFDDFVFHLFFSIILVG